METGEHFKYMIHGFSVHVILTTQNYIFKTMVRYSHAILIL